MPVASNVRPAEPDEPGAAPKLVDAFSALLAEEEGDGSPMVPGPVEMVGAPAPVPPPAVEWTPGQTAAAPVEAAAETVALQAVTVQAVEEAGDAREKRAAPAAVAAAQGRLSRRSRSVPTRPVTRTSMASTSTWSPTRWRRRYCTA